jgi:hypothetical protein
LRNGKGFSVQESGIEADFPETIFETTIMRWGGPELKGGSAYRFHYHSGQIKTDDPRARGLECSLQAMECLANLTPIAQQEVEVRIKKDNKKKKKGLMDVTKAEAETFVSIEVPYQCDDACYSKQQ